MRFLSSLDEFNTISTLLLIYRYKYILAEMLIVCDAPEYKKPIFCCCWTYCTFSYCCCVSVIFCALSQIHLYACTHFHVHVSRKRKRDRETRSLTVIIDFVYVRLCKGLLNCYVLHSNYINVCGYVVTGITVMRVFIALISPDLPVVRIPVLYLPWNFTRKLTRF